MPLLPSWPTQTMRRSASRFRTMDAEGSFNGCVHHDATVLANGGEREDVGQRVGIVPDRPKILDVADKRQNPGAAICVNLQLAVAAPDVSEEIRVLKTKTVDWLTRSTQDDGMSSRREGNWVKVKSETSWFALSSLATMALV